MASNYESGRKREIDYKRIIKLHKDGCTNSQIKERMGCSLKVIQKVIRGDYCEHTRIRNMAMAGTYSTTIGFSPICNECGQLVNVQVIE